MTFLIIGTGGVGGSIASFLALAGHDVTCIARGEHLRKIQMEGLLFRSDLKGEMCIPVKACTAEEYEGKPDVIFLCVKGYGLSGITHLLERTATQDNLVIPLLNGFGIGDAVSELIPQARVADGCIYIMAHIEGAGVICQRGSVFRMVVGMRKSENADYLVSVVEVLKASGIKVDVSADIRRDTFVKWAFISAMACTGAYYDTAMGALQTEGLPRQMFMGLSQESMAVAHGLGIQTLEPIVAYNTMVLDKTHPDSTASMQKDLAMGKPSEIASLLFDMLDLGTQLGIDMLYYQRVAEKFANLRH